MVELLGAAKREQALLEQLIENRQRMTNAVAQRILHPDMTTGKQHE